MKTMRNYLVFFAIAFLSLQAHAQANNASFVSQSVPTFMTTGQSYTVSVTMLNNGTTTWNSSSMYRLGSQNPQDNQTWGLGRVDSPSDVWIAPGVQYTFNFTVRAPATAGTYNFQWRMLREGYEWFGAFAPNVQVTVSPPPPVNNAAFVSQSIPTSMTTGQSYNVSVTMQNTGNTTWTAANLYRLGAQNPHDNQTWGFQRVELDASVAPGQQYTFNFTVRAPTTAGTYNFQWRMVRDGYEWFGPLTTNVQVAVSAPPFDNASFVSQSVPASMAAGKPYTVSITMQNTGNTTWTSGAAYKLGSQNPADNYTWRNSNRVELTSAVAPGQQYTFTLQVTAPAAASVYNFQWKMVREYTAWFGAASTNVAVTVHPPPTVSVTRSPSPMIAGQTYTLSWSTTGTTSLSYSCTSTGTGYTGTASVAVNGSSSGTASAGWVGYPSTCTWTATGTGGTSTFTETMNTVATPTNNAQFATQTIPASMTAGRPYPVSVTMTNNGTTTWTASAFQLGSQNPADNTTWGLSRVVVPGSVAPGQQVTFSFNVTAPAVAGTYNQQWRMLQEGAGSFGQTSANVAVTVVPAAPVITAPPKTRTRTVAYEYEAATGLLGREIIEPSNAQLRLEAANTYDGWGNLTSMTISSPATGTAAIVTRVTTAQFDARGQFATGHVNALNHSESVTFDARTGVPASVTGPNGLTTQWQFDGFGRKTLEIHADGTQTRWDYAYCGGAVSCPSPAQYVITETPYTAGGAAPNGPWVKRYFDMLDREVASQTPGFDDTSVVTVATVYDDLGRVAYVSRPYFSTQLPVWNTFTYDVLDRVTSARDGAGKGATLSYSGLQTVVRNALNQSRATVKDALGRVSTITDETNGVSRYEYDAFGNLYKTTDLAGNTVLMAYDLRGNKLQMTDPDMGSVLFAYDALGELVQQTDAKNQVTAVTYDKLGRVTNRTETDLVSSWTYDSCTKGVGKLCSTSADNGYAKSFGYDAYGRLINTVTTVDTSYSESLSFDANGRPATRTYPNGFAVKFGYTALGYLKTIRNNATNALYWQADTRDAEGVLLQQTFGNNVTAQQVVHPLTGRISNIYAGMGDSVQSLSYTFDDAGNLLSRGDANQGLSETFQYDSLRRLRNSTVSSSGAGVVTQTYGYDSIGNLTSRSDLGTYTYGPLNNRPHGITQIALNAGGKRTYTYDLNGNLTNEVQYDSANNVLSARGRAATYTGFDMPKTLASPSTTLTFTYGTDHQRIKQVSPAGTTIYIHPDNSGGLGYEKQIKPDGTVEHRYFIGADEPVAIVKQTGTTSTVRYLHLDHLGSVTAVTNEAGAVVERFSYEPFGKRRYPNGSLDTSGVLKGTNTNRGYTAAEQLDDLGLIHMNGRVYDPVTGRFMSADPGVPHPGDPQSFNRYSYTRNNPLAFVDPTGFTDVQKVTINDKKPSPSEQVYLTSFVTFRNARDDRGDELPTFSIHGVTAPVPPAVREAQVNPVQSVFSWLSRTLSTSQDMMNRGLRGEPRWEAEHEAFMASTQDSVLHGLHPLHGMQPYAATLGNASAELLKVWGNVMASLKLSGAHRALATAKMLMRLEQVAITHRGKAMTLTVNLKPTIDRIKSGGAFPHSNDGKTFKNDKNLLPVMPYGHYREFVHPTPGVAGAGPQRIITGQDGKMYYSPDHYWTFIPLNP